MKSLESVENKIVHCRQCPRLVRWRESIGRKKTKRYAEWQYWAKAVPGFGDPKAKLLIVGLAPGAHGANRTGRLFTGDRSGDWLFRTLHKAGFANQPISISRDDGLQLHNCYITAACRCAPPANKPTQQELQHCRPFLVEELRLLKNVKVILGLGKIAFESALLCAKEAGLITLDRKPRFSHGVTVSNENSLFLVGSYHPSQQNTFTKRLTEAMFDSIFEHIHHLIRTTP